MKVFVDIVSGDAISTEAKFFENVFLSVDDFRFEVSEGERIDVDDRNGSFLVLFHFVDIVEDGNDVFEFPGVFLNFAAQK